MPGQSRAEFLTARMGGIGGSSIASLLSEMLPVEYGCRRRLWYELSAYSTDGPENPTEPMVLGNILEAHTATYYSNKTGRTVREVGLKKHPTLSSLQVHVDRLIDPGPNDKQATTGTLEIKNVGDEMMAKINAEGALIDHICQIQHEILCHGTEWGAIAVGRRNDLLPLVAIELTARLAGEPIPVLPRQPKIVEFDIPRNEDICRLIEKEGPIFWETLKNESQIPARLEPEDPRCKRCNFRVRCQGQAVIDSVQPEHGIPKRTDIEPLIQEYRARVALFEEAEALVTETENKFKALLGKQTAIQVPVVIDGKQKWKNVLWRLSKARETVDGRRMAAAYDALRRAAIEAGIPGADLVPPSGDFINVGLPSRPLRLSGILPPKPKKKGEVPETDEAPEAYEDDLRETGYDGDAL